MTYYSPDWEKKHEREIIQVSNTVARGMGWKSADFKSLEDIPTLLKSDVELIIKDLESRREEWVS